MVAIKSKFLFLLVCFAEAIWLLAAQVIGNTIFLLPCLICFLALTAWAAVKGMVIPVLLFFLPFSPLLKIQPGTISFFTIALVLVYLIYIVMGSKKINIYHIIPGLLLIGLILAVKTVYDYSLSNSFVLFAVSLMLVPFLTREMEGNYDFYWLTMYFVIGVILAAITSRYLSVFPTISRYVRVINLFGVVRHSGYYSDPNFYSIHISAALSGVLVLLFEKAKKGRVLTLIVSAVILLYCGFLSVSKAFLVIIACLVLFWFVEFMSNKGKLSAKLMILLTLAIGIMFLLSSTLFTDLIDMMISRLTRGNGSLSDFTTGRIDRWMQYLVAFEEDPMLLLFGQGYTDILVGDRGSHNTLLQAVYQFGLVGSVFLIAWFVCYMRTLLSGKKLNSSHLTRMFILLTGSFGPWMALDLLFNDEFFLLPIYVCMGINMITKAKRDTSE